MDGFQHREGPDFYPLPVNVPDFHSYFKKMVPTTTSVEPTPSATLSPVWAAKHPPPPTDRKRSFPPHPVLDHPELHSYNREMTDTATSVVPTASPTLGLGSAPKYPHPPPPLTDGQSDKLGPGWKAKHPPPPTKRESSADVEKVVRSLMSPDQDDRPWQQPLEPVSPGTMQHMLGNATVLGSCSATHPRPDCSKLPGRAHGPSVLVFTGIMLAALAISNFLMAMTVWYFVRRSTHRPWHTFTCVAADGKHVHTWRLPYHPNPLYIVLFFALIPFMIMRTLIVLPLVWIKYVTEARFGRRIGIDAVTLLMPGFWEMEHCGLCVPLEELLEEEPRYPGYTRDHGWRTFARPSILSGELPAESHLSLI
ncbi:hypothetical protein KJ359_012306 [Pestalotiopsis sp. 9143b]|nr:hypothetical protein KJ359_012306 [Pestalotiopsis sp. 9143b]